MTPLTSLGARAALDAAWNEVRSTVPHGYEEREHIRLAYIVAALVHVAEDEDDLAWRAKERFRQTTNV
ncbi:hypothetical protein [Bosea sp. BIWAKO-01]|uniref:hypothetical protein n=1 Tax=Bosea sp. BIWAKO-01 TaxID=506668 RepID=UPI00085299A2|nr:hypothetical protein [Bosea sp. BIWAKO-01]GAU86689.1 hypothetical protein BIWAKO_06637 [Bosea sp. BIWAKO-01]